MLEIFKNKDVFRKVSPKIAFLVYVPSKILDSGGHVPQVPPSPVATPMVNSLLRAAVVYTDVPDNWCTTSALAPSLIRGIWLY